MRLLFHCCEFKVDVIDPKSYAEDAICLSEESFVGALGSFLYIFDFNHLQRHFNMQRLSSGGYDMLINGMGNKDYRYSSKRLGHEFRIHSPIDVKRHCLGVAENFNVLKGTLEEYVSGEVMQRECIDFSSRC